MIQRTGITTFALSIVQMDFTFIGKQMAKNLKHIFVQIVTVKSNVVQLRDDWTAYKDDLEYVYPFMFSLSEIAPLVFLSK